MRVILAIEVQEQPLPQSRTFLHYNYRLVKGAEVIRQTNSSDTFAALEDVSEGDYTAVVQAYADNGEPLGASVGTAVKIGGGNPAGTYLAPVSVAAALG